jgi:NADH-quinone oxidoreductase subunit L
MVNHTIYKSCLFFVAGSVQKQTGTSDLNQLAGLGRKMPITFIGFIIAALAISGVPPLNGFFSKELVFDAALQIHVGFYVAALIGAFGTAASFLKLGHSVFFGKPSTASQNAKESPWAMLIPILTLAFFCVLFGVANPLPLQGLVEPVLGSRLHESFSGLPHNWLLVGISLGVLALALVNHLFGVWRSGKALGAADHIHNAPGLKLFYRWAEAGLLDPYRIVGKLGAGLTYLLWGVDRIINWIFSRFVPTFTSDIGYSLGKIHIERPWMSVLWILAGAAFIAIYFIWIGV